MNKCFMRRTLASLILLASVKFAFADSFVVNKIEIKGLQRISRQTVLDYVNVKPGHSFDVKNASHVIQSLYATNFFSNITVSHDGGTLVIQVAERPTIASIKATGYTSVDKDKVNEVLKKAGLVAGMEFDPAELDKFKDSLQQQYYAIGHYNARVTDTVSKPDNRNRVDVSITVSEGRAARVSQIQVIGNKAFSESKVVDSMKSLTTTGLFTFFTKDDQYSRDKFDQAQSELIDFYQDHGYLHAKIDSAQAQLAPDRNSIYITIKVTEGDQYKVSGVEIVGKTIVPVADLQKLLKIKAGDISSKAKITESQKAVTDALGNKGYAFADVNVVPTVDEKTKTVKLALFVDPGRKVYIHKIRFSGNNQTSDIVLRRQATQLEGALSKTSAIKETERRIKNLGMYIQDAKSTIKPVPGKPNQVDLNYQITEAPPATAMAQLSYGTDGFGYGASVNNYSLLGSGKALSLAFNRSPYVKSYSMTYLNPYYTFDGISRSFNVYSQQYNPGAVNIANYSYQTFGGGVNYGIPVSAKDDTLSFGAGYENSKLGVGNAPSQQVLDFFNQFNTPANNSLIFNQLNLSTGWSRNSFDRFIFPTQGMNQGVTGTVSLPLGKQNLKYYKVGYNAHAYVPLSADHDFVFSALGGVGYGNGFGGTGNLPFFQNFFMGGIGSVRGYETNTLGPKDSLGNPIGGNFSVNGSASLIFPNFISPNNLRTSLFFDAGNVYNTHSSSATRVGESQPDAGPLRYSAGLGVEWRIPIVGVVNISVADPIHARAGDDKRFFQFTFGTQF